MKNFFKKAFADMKENAKSQHEADKANFNAVKAESKANWEEAKAMGNPQNAKKKIRAKQDEQIQNANQRISAAEERIRNAKTR